MTNQAEVAILLSAMQGQSSQATAAPSLCQCVQLCLPPTPHPHTHQACAPSVNLIVFH